MHNALDDYLERLCDHNGTIRAEIRADSEAPTGKDVVLLALGLANLIDAPPKGDGMGVKMFATVFNHACASTERIKKVKMGRLIAVDPDRVPREGDAPATMPYVLVKVFERLTKSVSGCPLDELPRQMVLNIIERCRKSAERMEQENCSAKGRD